MKSLSVLALVVIASAVSAAENRAIKVSAKSEIKVAPDEVVLDLAVHTRDAKLLVAKRENDGITATVLPLAERHGIPAKDMKITNLDVSPDYGGFGRERRATPIAYDFTRSIEVRLTDFEKIEPFLTDAFDRGLSDVRKLHFRVSNQREHQFEARKLAITYAREKATHLTELTGLKLGNPLRIEEDNEHNWDAGGFGGVAISDRGAVPIELSATKPRFVFISAQKDEPADGRATLIATGQIIISAHVTVEFEMLPN